MIHTVAKNMELGSFTKRNKVMHSILSDLKKLKPHKNNHNYQKCAQRSFILSLLNLQSDLCA